MFFAMNHFPSIPDVTGHELRQRIQRALTIEQATRLPEIVQQVCGCSVSTVNNTLSGRTASTKVLCALSVILGLPVLDVLNPKRPIDAKNLHPVLSRSEKLAA